MSTNIEREVNEGVYNYMHNSKVRGMISLSVRESTMDYVYDFVLMNVRFDVGVPLRGICSNVYNVINNYEN